MKMKLISCGSQKWQTPPWRVSVSRSGTSWIDLVVLGRTQKEKKRRKFVLKGPSLLPSSPFQRIQRESPPTLLLPPRTAAPSGPFPRLQTHSALSPTVQTLLTRVVATMTLQGLASQKLHQVALKMKERQKHQEDSA